MDQSSLHGYYSNHRRDMQCVVPDGLHRVLDVGCGGGNFGRGLLASGKASEMWGIELNAEAAEHARGAFTRVDQGDAIERLGAMPEAHFDAITFTDVLEHLAWPDEALRQTHRLLKPGGVVVASLPNIRYLPALRDIALRREFRYTDEGIFDRTHLRFFTASTIPDWFERGGLKIDRMEGINPLTGWRFMWLNRLTLGWFDDCRWLQYAIVARPQGA